MEARENLHLDVSFLRNSVKIIWYAVESFYEYSYIHMELLNKLIIKMNMAVWIPSLVPEFNPALYKISFLKFISNQKEYNL